MSIQILPPRLANQIAAGEVVERPASVIKELVENSLDANADKIDIEIDRGGHKRMLIRDNGNGIVKDELALALSRHATSKINSLDDLEHICSLGFRGEALASVSSVARLSLTSKPPEQAQAWQANCEGRDMDVVVNPAAHPDGSSVEVCDLFFNTPARRKFLKSEKTEFFHIDELIKRIALSRFDVAFSLKHNNKLMRKFPKATTDEAKFKRVSNIFGNEFAEHAMSIDSQYQGIKLTGWVASSLCTRPTNELQYFYVNGRMMRDKLINHAVRQAFNEVIEQEGQPCFVLYLSLDPEEVDVNVHPAKHEVRFHQSRLIHDFIYKALLDVLQQQVGLIDESETSQHAVFEQPKHDYIAPLSSVSHPPSQYSGSPQTSSGSYRSTGQYSVQGQYTSRQVDTQAASNYQSLMSAPKSNPSEQATESGQFLLVDDNSYLIQDEEHYYHLTVEQVLCQHIEHVLTDREIVSQPLLMPVSIQVSKEQLAQFSSLSEQLLGFGIEMVLANKRVMIRKVPAPFRQIDWVKAADFLLLNLQDSFSAKTLYKAVSVSVIQETKNPLYYLNTVKAHLSNEWQAWLSANAIKVPLGQVLQDWVKTHGQ